jgi:hypothetical protein
MQDERYQPFTKKYTLPSIDESLMSCRCCKTKFSSSIYQEHAPVQLNPCGHFLCFDCARDLVRPMDHVILPILSCTECGKPIDVSECILMGSTELRHHLITKQDIHRRGAEPTRMIEEDFIKNNDEICKSCSSQFIESSEIYTVHIVPTSVINCNDPVGILKDEIQPPLSPQQSEEGDFGGSDSDAEDCEAIQREIKPPSPTPSQTTTKINSNNKRSVVNTTQTSDEEGEYHEYREDDELFNVPIQDSQKPRKKNKHINNNQTRFVIVID